MACVSKTGVAYGGSTNDSKDGSEESEDHSFYNNLFAEEEPRLTYVSAPTDSFPRADDSNSESNTFVTVKFSINTSESMAVAEYENIEYRIGFLYLTAENHEYLRIIKKLRLNSILIRAILLYVTINFTSNE